MPINPKLKKQLETEIKMDDAYRARLLEALEDAPADVQNLWMGQSEVTRRLNEIKAEQEDWAKKNDKFYKDSNLAIEQWKTQVTTAETEAAAARARVAELEAGGGTLKTPAEEDATAKELKEMRAILATVTGKLEKVVTPDGLNSAYKDAVGFMGEQSIKLRKIEKLHEQTFGEDFGEEKTLELIKFANEKSAEEGRRIPLDRAYEMQMADAIKKKHDEQVAAKAIEEYKSRTETPGSASPSGGTGPVGRGPLEIRLAQERERAAGGAGDKGYATWQEAAAEGGRELVKEGKY